MSNTETGLSVSRAAILSKLSIERCQCYLAHMHAIMHLDVPHDMCGDEAMAQDNIRAIMSNIERELSQNAERLRFFE